MYSVLTGLCVGVGTVLFFLLFQKGGPLSAVPMVLAGGAALMAIIGIVFFKERASWVRLLGIVLSIAGLFLLRYTPTKDPVSRAAMPGASVKETDRQADKQ